MDSVKRRTLQKQRLALKKDLQGNCSHVVDVLYSQEVFNQDDYDRFLSEPTESGKVDFILNNLPKRGPRAFDVFLEGLRETHPWLAEKLEATLILLLEETNGTESNPHWDEVLIRGGVPSSVMNHVSRKLVTDARRALERLAKYRQGYLFFHGMVGIGKSYLAAEVVRDKSVEKLYPGGVFWVGCGECEEGTLLIKMQNLCEKLDKEYRKFTANCVETASQRLRELLHRDKCLLMLDDVWTYETLNAFDVGVNVLVTMQHIDFARDKLLTGEITGISEFFPVTYLSQDESKELLSKHVNLPTANLPAEADSICRECSGNPLLIAMLAGVDLAPYTHDPGRWNRCLELIHRRRRGSKEDNVDKVTEMMRLAVSRSINCLPENTQVYYRDFCVFIDDVHVPREVLSVLWGVDKHAVDDIMEEFVSKSLANRDWNEKKQTNVYTLHDLHLTYLKNENAQNIQEFHSKLVTQYRKLCHGNWEELPADNYIHWFLGYHLYRSDLQFLLADIYLDLKYVIQKLKITGPGDLLYDYRRYGRIIERKDATARVDFQKFIAGYAHLLSEKNADVLQLALCQPESSAVYKNAKAIVVSGGDSKLYFELRNKDAVKSSCIASNRLHSGPVYCALFTPGGRVISCGFDATIRIWDSRLTKELVRIRGHQQEITCCSLSSDGNHLATCSSDRTVKVWRLQNVEKEHSDTDGSNGHSPTSFIGREQIHADMLARSTPYETPIVSFDDDSVMCCAISPDGKEVVSGGRDKLVKVWCLTSKSLKYSLEGHNDNVNSCRFAPDGKFFATGSADGTIRIWDSANRKIVQELVVNVSCNTPAAAVCSLCFFCTGLQLAAAANQSILVWKTHSGEQILELREPNDACIRSVSVSSDGRLIAAGTTSPAVIIWNVDSKAIVAYHKGHKEWIHCVSFSKCTEKLLSTSDDKIVMLWDTHDVASDQPSYRMLFSASFGGSSTVVAVADVNNRIQVISDGSDRIIIQTSQTTVVTACQRLRGSKSFNIVVGFDDGHVEVYNTAGKLTHTLRGHESAVRHVVMTSTNTDTVVTAGDDSSVRIWSLEENGTVTEVTCLGHTYQVEGLKLFSDQSKVVSWSYDAKVMVWDVLTGSCLYVCEGHQDSVLVCDISSDGKLILSGSADKTTKLWNAIDGTFIRSYPHDACVRSVLFTPDGNSVVTGDDHGIARIWNVDGDSSSRRFGEDGQDAWIYDMAVNQTSDVLLTLSNTLKWWDLRSGKCLQTFHIQGKLAKRIQSSPDFKTFVTVDNAGVLYVLSQIERSQV